MTTLFLRHVLVAVDLSDRSRHTALHAADIAQTYHARVTLLHVVPPSDGDDDAAKDETAKQLAALSALSNEFFQGRAHIVVKEGDPQEEILRYTRGHDVDLVVTGVRHRGALDWIFSESVAEDVARCGAWSVLAVPDPTTEARTPPTESSEVLCAIDLSESSPVVLQTALDLARTLRARTTILHVLESWPWQHSWPSTDEENRRRRLWLERSAAERVSRLARRFAGPTQEWDTMIASGSVADEILRVASARRSALTVIGAYAYSRGPWLEPTASQVLRRGPCPVLLVPTTTADQIDTLHDQEISVLAGR